MKTITGESVRSGMKMSKSKQSKGMKLMHGKVMAAAKAKAMPKGAC